MRVVVSDQRGRAPCAGHWPARGLDLIRCAPPDTGTVSSWWASMDPHVETLAARWPAEEADPELAKLLTTTAIHPRRGGVYRLQTHSPNAR